LNRVLILASLILLASVVVEAAAVPVKGLKLVVNGKSSYVIVSPDAPIPSEVTASTELQTYIRQSTGVNLPIINQSSLKSGAPAIMLGPTRFAEKVGITPRGPEKWVIKTVGNRLVLTGGRPRGTLYAVYHFLEDVMGVHWWTMWEETVPKLAVLSVGTLDLSGEPGFSYRDIYDAEIPWPKEFYARNRINGHFSMIPWQYGGAIQYGPPYHVHTFNLYFPPGEYFASHPEYFSLSKGQRVYNGQLCLTNPDVLSEWILKMKDYIKTSYAEADKKGVPRPVYFSVSQNDWEGSCECDNCKAIYEKEGHSGLSLMFVNAVAEEIEKEYPDVLVDTLAYWFYQEAPKTIKPRDNVRIRLCDSSEDIFHSIDHLNNKDGLRRLKAWSKITKHLDIWKYGVVYSPNLPLPSQLNYSDDVKEYKMAGVQGMFMEFENILTTDMWDMKAWMLAKVYENPYADSDTLVKQFTDGYYGPAGQYIREYLITLQKALHDEPSYINFTQGPSEYKFMKLDVVRKCNELFDKAEASVADNQTILDRVLFARTSLDRAICYRSADLYSEYVQGGKKGDYGLSTVKSSKRASDILLKMAIARFAGRKQYAEHAYSQITELGKFAAFAKPAVIPDQFVNLPPNTVFECSPKYFRLVGSTIVNDTSAAFGIAAKLDLASTGGDAPKYLVTPTQGMLIGQYNAVEKVEAGSTTITRDAIKPGYNFYKFGPRKFKPSEFVYLFWSWGIQVDLDSALNNNPDQDYDVYVSVKFEGPSFPNGDPTQPDSISVDRVIIVQIGAK